MPSITSWMRLEPRCREAGMDLSLQARIHDPLWLLARQWQFGEFQGEDNGTPVVATWRAEGARLTRYHSGAIAPNTRASGAAYDGRSMPLESLVERETIRPGGPGATPVAAPEKLRFAAESGQHFLRMLKQKPLSRDYRQAFLAAFPFPALTQDQSGALDEDSRNFLAFMAPRVPDGRAMYKALRPGGPGGAIVLAPSLNIAAADRAEVEKAAISWLQWVDTLFSEPDGPNPTWQSDRLEYAFSVGTRLSDGEKVLTASEYSGGHLDWHSFDANPEVSLGGTQDNTATELVRSVIPAPVSFRGMPASRFWEFEDAQVDLGSVEAGPTDLGKMLMVQFALDYGNDWFVLPIDLDVGSLYRTRSLVITDTFGVRTLVKPSSESGEPHSLWRMFQLSNTRSSGIKDPAPNLFFLPPSLLSSIGNRPIEEVLFLRDEMANLAWAVERVVESPAEQPLNRFQDSLQREQLRPAAIPEPLPAGSAMRYRLSTSVPEYWVPLMPVLGEKGLRLRRGAVLKTDGATEIIRARGHILESGQELSLFEEEVPREGLRVTRSYQFTRWLDGSSHFWIGRRKAVGRGEGSSGLRFDSLEGKADLN